MIILVEMYNRFLFCFVSVSVFVSSADLNSFQRILANILMTMLSLFFGMVLFCM